MGKRRKRKNRAPLNMAMTNAHVKYRNHPRYYVGYGSNHNLVQMSWRCPNADPVCAGMMPDKKLVFSDVLTVEDCKGASTLVSIWHVTPTDILALDRYEGYPRLYGKRYTHVRVGDKICEAFYYTMNDPYAICPPSKHYEATVRQGYRDWGFSMELLDEAIAEAWAAYSPADYAKQLTDDYFGHEWDKWEEEHCADDTFDPAELDWDGAERGIIYGARPSEDNERGKWADDPDPFDDDYYEPFRKDDWLKRVVW